MRPALLIFNPTAGQRRPRRLLASLLETLRAAGFTIETVPTEAPGHAGVLARDAALSGGFEVVFVLGGDGTLREAAEGLVGARVPLAILPGGTVNVLARAVGIPGRPVAAARLYAAAAVGESLPVRRIDTGRCGERVFLMMASIGLDARVLARVDPRTKRRWGRAAILWQGLLESWRYGYPDYELLAGGGRYRASFAVVANIPYYGGSFRLVPGASLDDGQLDLFLFHGSGRGSTLRFALQLLAGVHLRRSDVRTLRAEAVEIQGSGPAMLQIDGDAVEESLPVRITVAEERLSLLVPGV